MEITPLMLQEFKDRMHISHSSEDKNLELLLKNSAAALKRMVGDYDIHTNYEVKELVFERARYAYNDSLEYFQENFVSEILSLGLSMLPEVEVDEV